MYYNHTERSVCKQCVITSSNPNSVLRHVLSTERGNECNWEKATKILLKVAFEDWSADFFCSLCLFVASNQQLYMNPKFHSKCCQNVAKMLQKCCEGRKRARKEQKIQYWDSVTDRSGFPTTRWSLCYWYLDFYVNHQRKIVQRCAKSLVRFPDWLECLHSVGRRTWLDKMLSGSQTHWTQGGCGRSNALKILVKKLPKRIF